MFSIHHLLVLPISIAVITGFLGEAPCNSTVTIAAIMMAIGMFIGALFRAFILYRAERAITNRVYSA